MRFYGAEYSNGEGHRITEYFKSKSKAKAAVEAHNNSDAYKQGEPDLYGNYAAWEPAIVEGSTVMPVNADKLLYYMNYSSACHCGFGDEGIGDE
tara:strand:- start:369 stop:650 length:282 start_codon:yes stop_codon:yes gene_type:complete